MDENNNQVEKFTVEDMKTLPEANVWYFSRYILSEVRKWVRQQQKEAEEANLKGEGT